MRITKTTAHAFIQVIDTGDTLLNDIARQVDDHGQYPLGHKADTVIDHTDAHAIAAQQRMGGIAHVGMGSGI
ncbi:hypothetical protein D3C76_1408900 [compost metagenome]